VLQPVTQGEVDKAARISPLALCLVKPPAPELLHSMPVRDQRQLLADWAEATNLAATLTPLSTTTKKTTKPATRHEGTLLISSTADFVVDCEPAMQLSAHSDDQCTRDYLFFNKYTVQSVPISVVVYIHTIHTRMAWHRTSAIVIGDY